MRTAWFEETDEKAITVGLAPLVTPLVSGISPTSDRTRTYARRPRASAGGSATIAAPHGTWPSTGPAGRHGFVKPGLVRAHGARRWTSWDDIDLDTDDFPALGTERDQIHLVRLGRSVEP